MSLLSRTGNALRPTLANASRTMVGPSAKRMEHTLPSLPYAYDALEPHISKEIMTLHHTKHHQTYVTGLNAAEKQYAKLSEAGVNDVSNLPLTEQIALQAALKFNGGGHINHSLFWNNLNPDGGKLNDGNVKALIDRDFGGLESFKKEFNAKTAAIQGSGWGWVGYNKASKRLEIVTTANQDPLTSHVPIIGVDIWEHAFYLQYKNVKPDYLNAIWNVIDFTEAERRLSSVIQN